MLSMMTALRILTCSLSLMCVQSIASTTTPCTTPLTCLLSTLVIDIPDVCFDVSGSALCLSNAYCDSFSLVGIPSAYIPSTSLSLTVNDLGLSINSDYTYMRSSGSMEGTASNAVINIVTDVVKSPLTMYPFNSTVDMCEFNSIDVSLSFTNSPILNSLSGVIATLIESELKKVICAKVIGVIDVNGTVLIQSSIDPLLQSIVSSQPSIVPMAYEVSDEYFHWQSSMLSLVQKLIGHATMNTSIASCMNPLISELVGIPMIDYVIDSVTNGTGYIYMYPLDIPLASSASINMTLTALNISGLNSFSIISLRPSTTSNISLVATVMLDFIDLVVSIQNNVTVSDTPLLTAYDAVLRIDNISTDIELAVAVNISTLSNLYMDQAQNVSCLLSTIDYFSVISFTLYTNISTITIISTTASDASDGVQLFDSLMSLVTMGYAELLSAFVNGVGQSALRSYINTQISIIFNNLSICPTHVTYDPDDVALVVWAESPLNTIDILLDDRFGVAGVNSFFDCLTSNTGKIAIDMGDVTVTVGGLNTFRYVVASITLSTLCYLTHTYTHTHIHIHTLIHICTYIHSYTYTHAYTHTHITTIDMSVNLKLCMCGTTIQTNCMTSAPLLASVTIEGRYQCQ